uniref:EF-hand domain-containing protein n=1 Tax=Globodera pallida TaxID=36090 RepID=A0A183BUU5_GLOPA
MRISKPPRDYPRPLQVNMVFPVVFLIGCIFLVVFPMYQAPLDTAIGIGIMLTGLPVYFLFIEWRDKIPHLDSMMGLKKTDIIHNTFCLRKMPIKIGLFLFVFIKLLFLGNIDEVSSCAVEMHDFGCCAEGYFLWKCPGAYKPDCNMFGHNCVGCRYVFEPYECTRHRVACSCYYCCDPQYADSCPDGCAECIKDGEGGCPQNSGKFFKSLGNSSSSMLASVEKARKHFDMIDVDKNGSISLTEAIEHLAQLNNGTAAAGNVAATNVSWFAKLDSNGNNQN